MLRGRKKSYCATGQT